MSDEKRRATSWSGSERGRREQGVCLPPSRPSNRASRFTVPRGVRCLVRRVSGVEWRDHVTAHDCGFDRYETFADFHYEFRLKGWIMRVNCRHVKKWSEASDKA